MNGWDALSHGLMRWTTDCTSHLLREQIEEDSITFLWKINPINHYYTRDPFNWTMERQGYGCACPWSSGAVVTIGFRWNNTTHLIYITISCRTRQECISLVYNLLPRLLFSHALSAPLLMSGEASIYACWIFLLAARTQQVRGVIIKTSWVIIN